MAFVFGVNGTSGHNSASSVMPQAYVPPIYGANTPVVISNTALGISIPETTTYYLGIRVWSFIEFGLAGNDNDYDRFGSRPQTLWGSYGTGNYAAIAEMTLRTETVGWYVKLQTPDIRLAREFTVSPFVSVNSAKQDINFEAGYSRYDIAYNPATSSLRLGTVNKLPVHYGLNFDWHMDNHTTMGLQVFGLNNHDSVSLTSQGQEFDTLFKESNWELGLGAHAEFRF